jgi:predicted regulator of Ras-like GTPase activity (Roadblock/LC7/MglB family)
VSAIALRALVADVARQRGVRGVLVADRHDAIPIVCTLDVDVDGDAVAALAVSLQGHARRALDVAGYGRAAFLQVQGDHGWLCVADAGGFVLAAVADPRANVALLRLSMLRARDALVA